MAEVAQAQPPGFPTTMFLNTMAEFLREPPQGAALAPEPLPPSASHEILEVGPEFLEGFDPSAEDESDTESA